MADQIQMLPVLPALAKRGYRFAHSFRVRYRDIDRQGIVFNGNYMSYLDFGITEYLRMLGFSWRGMEHHQLDIVVVRSTIDFKAPARLDDLLHVGVRTACVGDTSFTVKFTIWGEDAITGDGKVVVEAEHVYVNFNARLNRSRSVPVEVRQAIAAFEGQTAAMPDPQ